MASNSHTQHDTHAQLRPPPSVVTITRVLEDAGYEAWCVGGAVRDALLGSQHLDWDMATSATPQQVRKLFRRTVPIGIQFGTVGVLDDNGVMHEVTTFRRDVETDGRHAVVKFGVSLDDDLARRDFTINAIAYSPARNEIRDPFGGRNDLEAGLVRAVGVPQERLREDRLRALRAIRFAARFDFRIEQATWSAIQSTAPHLHHLSAERIKQEIEKTMEQVQCPSRAFRAWRDSGAFATVVSSLAKIDDAQLDALDFSRQPQASSHPNIFRRRKLARLALLFSAAPRGTVLATVQALRFSNIDANWISAIADRWHTLGQEMKTQLLNDAAPDDATLRRWAGVMGRTKTASVLRLANAVWHAERKAGKRVPDAGRVKSVYRRIERIAYRDPIELADLAVNGNDLKRIGIQGKNLGVVLRTLLQQVIEDPTRNQRDTLLALGAQMRESPDPGAR